jgi:hypothetical protein
MGQGFDGDVVAAVDLDDRLQELAEVTPMNRVGRRRHIVMIGPALLSGGGLGDRGRDHGPAGDERSRATGRDEGALHEAAPFAVEFVEQLLAMKFEIRAILVVAFAHRTVPPWC